MANPSSLSNLDTLAPSRGTNDKRKRVGRGIGSGTGKTAGRGHKGQTARSGRGRPRGFEGGQTPLYRRIPKFGFKNFFRKEYGVVNLAALDSHFKDGDNVTPEKLVEIGLLRSNCGALKILGEGTLTKKLTVKAHKFSKSATQKINQAGGSVEEIKLGVG